jgi:hypothetical protein
MLINNMPTTLRPAHRILLYGPASRLAMPVLDGPTNISERKFPTGTGNGYQRRQAIIGASPEERASCSTSRVVTTNDLRDVCPNVVLIATSAASRPLAIRIRPIRGMLWRASNVCQRPPTNASNQALKSIGAGSGGTPISPR